MAMDDRPHAEAGRPVLEGDRARLGDDRPHPEVDWEAVEGWPEFQDLVRSGDYAAWITASQKPAVMDRRSHVAGALSPVGLERSFTVSVSQVPANGLSPYRRGPVRSSRGREENRLRAWAE